MSAHPWYRRYGSDFIAGTMGLTLEEKGAYSLVLDLIYDRGGPIPDDPRYIAGVCGCSIRKWNAIRERLIEAGKITLAEGRITSPVLGKWDQNPDRETIPAWMKEEIRERDDNKCRYCGDTAARLHFDHVFPHSRGGSTSVANLVLACAPCNLSKGARTPEEWLQ